MFSELTLLSVLDMVLSLTFLLYGVGMTVIILLDNKPAQSTIAWLLTVYFLPFIGIFIYIFAGVNWKKRKLLHHRPEERFSQQLAPVLKRQENFILNDDSLNNDTQKSIHLLIKSNHAVLTIHNQCDIFHHGEAFFEQLKSDLKRAKSFIHMEYFIWKSDQLGLEIAEILIEKSLSGVEVRLIFDGIGCFWTMSKTYKTRLKKAGIVFRIFLDPLNLGIGIGGANYLNHRKIVVIDGHIGYLGGMNIGQEYITGGKFDYWRDTHLRLSGEAVQQLQTIFATDWYNTCKEWLNGKKYFPAPKPHTEAELLVQIACSGPDSDWHSIKQLFFNLIINANREVYIQSPYFIPDEGIATAMETAALSGVQVHLMMTGIPDKKIPFWAAETYFERMLKAGVRIYQYTQGFLHCKTLCIDEMISSVGTCNMDVRSFHLDYEVNAVIYDVPTAQNIKQQFEIDLQDCIEVTLKDLNLKSLWLKLRNGALRVLSPLL